MRDYDVCKTSNMVLYKNSKYVAIKDFVSENDVIVKKGSILKYTGKKSIEGYAMFLDGVVIEISRPEDVLELYSSVQEDCKRFGMYIYECCDMLSWVRSVSEYYDSFEKEKVDEASMVTFGKKMYPKFGWACVMAGGAGSGKGFTVSNIIGLEAKIFNVDDLKELYVKVIGKGSKDSKISKGEEKKSFDFKNPEEVSYLHQKISNKAYLKKQENAFYSNNQESQENERIPNVIYDITGDKAAKLERIGKMLKDMGYKTSLVWVVTNREVALLRNLSRSRTVPDSVFHDTHNNVNKTIFPFLESDSAKYYDEAWVVFSSEGGIKSQSKEEKELFKKNRVVKIEKSGSSFKIPKELSDRVASVLGADEENPENPTTYMNQSKAKEVLEPYKQKKLVKGYDGIEREEISYSDKKKKYDNVSLKN